MKRIDPSALLNHAQSIEHLPVDGLLPRPGNPRKHSKRQVRQIANSIREFGFTNPILIDSAGCVVAGHGRLEAAKLLDMERVPVLRLEHLTPDQVRAYVIADNRLAEKAQWDTELLTLELGELVNVDFNVQLTGFDTAEVDALLCPVLDDDDEPDDLPLVDPMAPPVSRLGDLWLIGDHRLYCGDATDAASYEQVLGAEQAGLIFTDPPYNVPIDGHASVAHGSRHGQFVMASGEMSREEFTDFLRRFVRQLVNHSRSGSIHFICIDWRHIGELLQAAEEQYSELKNLCVWNKANAGMGSLYRSKHELVFVFKSGTAPHVNNVELGKHGRNRTNVWNYAGVTSMHKGRAKKLEMHPTVKPVAMIADAIKDCSNLNDVVLDPFGGSGSTLVAAHKTGRRARLVELDPRYVDVAIRRFERMGLLARHAESGRTFNEVAQQRAAELEHV